MENLLESNIFDMDIEYLLEDLEEFSEAIEEMDLFLSPMIYMEQADVEYAYHRMILEDVTTNGKSTKSHKDKVYKKVKSAEINVGKAAWDAAGAGGTILRTTANVCLSGITLISKLVGFISRKIQGIPEAFSSIGSKLKDLPANVIARIKGDLVLYVDEKSIKLFNDNILPNIVKFIELGNKITSTDEWISWSTAKGLKGKGSSLLNSDKTSMKAMSKLTKKLATFDINTDAIDMSDDYNVEVYIKAAEVIDINGTKKSYYKCIDHIFSQLTEQQTLLKRLNKAINIKKEGERMNDGFATLPGDIRNYITNTITNTGIVIKCVAKFISAVSKDLNTINKKINSLHS